MSAALRDGRAGGVPERPRIVTIAVDLEHRRNDVGDITAAVDDAAEVAKVLLAPLDAVRCIRSADSLVACHHDLGVQRGNRVQTGDPRLPQRLVRLCSHHVYSVVHDVSADDSVNGEYIEHGSDI